MLSLLFQYSLNLSDFEFLWCDLFILTTLSLTCEYIYITNSSLYVFAVSVGMCIIIVAVPECLYLHFHS